MATLSLLFSLLLLSTTTSATTTLSSILQRHGYSLSAAILDIASHHHHRLHLLHSWNSTGTLFLPSDAALSHRFHRETNSVFLYHAARAPPLRWSDLLTLPPGSPIPTFSRRRRCLFVRRNHLGEPCLASSDRRTARCVAIKHRDMYVGSELVVHGVDGVLDPATASGCYSGTTWRHHSHLNRAVRALRRRGYAAVASEIERRRSELSELPAVTVFAHRGHVVPRRYNILRHVAPRRYRLLDLSRLPRGARIATLAANSTVTVGTNRGLTVDGIAVDSNEIFRNRWAVVLSIRHMLPISDDVADQVSDSLDYADSLVTGDEFPATATLIDRDFVDVIGSTPGPASNVESSMFDGQTLSDASEGGDHCRVVAVTAACDSAGPTPPDVAAPGPSDWWE